MPNIIRKDIHLVDEKSFGYIFEQNVTIQLKDDRGVVRVNVYRPKSIEEKFPVLVTYGPYGKDIHYADFHAKSFSEVPDEHHSAHSAWETPDPGFWTKHGYAIVRGDEVGLGQSPGELNTMSRDTSLAFKDVIEWSADQHWSTGKVGLLGVSYYAGSQWRVAARQPKGLKCIIPWEGMSDYYRDRCRHGGILSNAFIDFWWNRQVITNQYGRPGRAASNWGPDTLEGDLSLEELKKNCRDQTVDNANNRFLDDDYYASKDFNLKDIRVPILSVANWGGIHLHLRGNIEGFMYAGSELKYLRFATGRHDLPFYTKKSVDLQKSFLDAFLKGCDSVGWSTGKAPRVELVVRKGNPGVNNPEAEKAFPTRLEEEWPLPRTTYTKYYLGQDHSLSAGQPSHQGIGNLAYQAPSGIKEQYTLQFKTSPTEREVEFTGHVVAHLNVSASALKPTSSPPSEIDLFLTLRHLDANGNEVFYTGADGDSVPVCKGWLRVSLRKTNDQNSQHKFWHPYREYRSIDVLPVVPGDVYTVDVELWPTSVVLTRGEVLVFEVSSGDTQGAGRFEHNSSIDRPLERLQGFNHIHFGDGLENYILLPVIPAE
ncbi:uncharacterized protein A1O9_02195 [Exophiala aquamarina CBS 119918]|uniref:Xaa-Pro dipeptidyl-peptidase C-terminal domain-containing protein n=1 Tax=Exophiala aquamarina CBS 119918 TaxID=1182545 RepID=A0A072PKJ5_9EURO|nr:uncharacterized protein A1O9_02195 [Exophiala aquamarina CBS 119918]KEF60634.1 hypothetical protein A1O9_02195 [Exophiala aquamarina CBS 119918]